MYSIQNPVKLDFTGVTYCLQFHRILKETLVFPDYYGENWDALWDCLTDMAGQEICLEIYGMDTLRTRLPETAEKFVEILQEWTQYVRDLHTGDIQIHFMGDRKETML